MQPCKLCTLLRTETSAYSDRHYLTGSVTALTSVTHSDESEGPAPHRPVTTIRWIRNADWIRQIFSWQLEPLGLFQTSAWTFLELFLRLYVRFVIEKNSLQLESLSVLGEVCHTLCNLVYWNLLQTKKSLNIYLSSIQFEKFASF